MKKLLTFIINLYLIFIVADVSFAAAAVEQQKRAAQRQQAIQEAVKQKMYQQAIAQKQMQQQMAQRQMYEQAMKQRVGQQQANAYRQVIAQRQANAYQQQTVMAQRQMQQAAASQIAQQQAMYQQAASVQAQQQALYQRGAQQAALQGMVAGSAYNPDLSAQAYSDREELNQLAQNQLTGFTPPNDYPGQFDAVFSEPDEVVDIKDLWRELESSSEAWPMMMDMAPKVATIEKYKDYFGQQGVEISKAPENYVTLIDELVMQNPGFLQNRFEDLFRLAAIMEYDFKNGEDSDALARRVLGDQVYEQNKKRLGK